MKGISYLNVNNLFYLEICEKNNGISSIKFVDNIINNTQESKLTKECKHQLEEYFQGKRKKFNIKLDIFANEFQMKCYEILKNIEYGKTISYKDEAILYGDVKYTRAVGNANSKNPLPIIIPCHRVIKSNGDIGGYTTNVKSKLNLKKFLIDLEKKYLIEY